MLSYLAAFIFYTLAMVGIMLTAFIVYKKMNITTQQTSKGNIKILDSCPIGAKKNLLVVQIKNERFLIASGLEHTTFLAKLNNDVEIVEKEENFKQDLNQEFEREVQKAPKKDSYEYLYKAQQSLADTKDELKKMYLDDEVLNRKMNNAITRKEILQELMSDIKNKKVSGSRF